MSNADLNIWIHCDTKLELSTPSCLGKQISERLNTLLPDKCTKSCCIAGKRMASFQSQGFQLLGWRRKGHTNTIHEKHWLVLVRNGISHDWAVPVAIHMSIQALLVPTPTHATLLPAWNSPSCVSIESPPKTHGSSRAHQVDECVSKACLCLEVNGQI